MNRKIIAMIKRKDEEGLNLLMNTYMNNIHYIASTIIGSYGEKEDIQECVSDILLSIWKDIDTFDENRGTLKTFILIKSKYLSLDYKRKLVKKKEKLKEEVFEDIDILNIEDKSLYNNEIINDVMNILRNFKEPDKTYFYLRYFMDYDIKSIADKFKDSKSGVENRLYRCRLKIKNKLRRE